MTVHTIIMIMTIITGGLWLFARNVKYETAKKLELLTLLSSLACFVSLIVLMYLGEIT